MRLLTWNVLHRIHAENYDEGFVARWPDEAPRVRGVVERVAGALESGGMQAALLQEVSGDVLAALRVRLAGHAVLHHVFPRVPRQKGPRTVLDPSEHLVVVAPAGAVVQRTHTFATDPGKGFLQVALPSGLTVLCTHLSWGEKAPQQLEQLAAAFLAVLGPVVLGGDFNTGREALAAFEAEVGVPPPGALCTRPRASGGVDIDHLLCRNARLREVAVLEHHELSDHRPVAASMTG